MHTYDELPSLDLDQDTSSNDPIPEADNAGAASIDWDAACVVAQAAAYERLEGVKARADGIGPLYHMVEAYFNHSDLSYLKWATSFTRIDPSVIAECENTTELRVAFGMCESPHIQGFPTPSGPRVTRVAGEGFRPYLTIDMVAMTESEESTRRGDMEVSGLYGDTVSALYRDIITREGLGKNPELAEAPPAIEQVCSILNLLFRAGYSVPESEMHPDNYALLWCAENNNGRFMLHHNRARSAAYFQFDYAVLKDLDAAMKAASRKFVDSLYDEDSATTVIL